MKNVTTMRKALVALGVPKAQTTDICCLSLLSLAGIGKADAFGSATNEWMRIHDVIAFTNANYRTRKNAYAENSRETFRKQAMHHFRNAAFIEDNGKATNSPDYRKFADKLAWDTEVWIADAPDHMIHLNGDRFMGPRMANA